MVTRARRRLSGILARWAVRIDPDPPFVFTTTRRIDTPPQEELLAAVVNAVNGGIGTRIGLRRPPGDIARY